MSSLMVSGESLGIGEMKPKGESITNSSDQGPNSLVRCLPVTEVQVTDLDSEELQCACPSSKVIPLRITRLG